MNEQEISKQLAENTKALRELEVVTRRTARYVKWLRVTDIIKLLLILIPLVAAWLYLPNIIHFFTEGYGKLIPGLTR